MNRLGGVGVSFALLAALSGCSSKARPVPEAPWSVTVGEATGASLCAAEAQCVAAGAGPHAGAGLLKTAPDGRAVVTLDEETTCELGPAATVRFVDERPRRLLVEAGVVSIRRATGAAPAKARVLFGIGDQTADLGARAVLSASVRGAGERATVTLEAGSADFREGTDAPLTLHAGETAAIVKGKPLDRRAAYTGEVARVERPLGEKERSSQAAPRGLGTMTARAPGTEDVVSGVRLLSHHVRADVRNGFARTEIEEVFGNDTDRVLEGRYVFAVPPGAVTARLALWVDGKLVEDEVVERTRAAAVFKGIVDDTVRPRDPALLEWVASGELSLKVFPIPAKGSRKVVLAYDEPVQATGDEARYVLPLSLGAARANAIDDLAIDVTVSESGGAPEGLAAVGYPAEIARAASEATAKLSQTGARPDRDFALAWRRKPAPVEASAFVPAWGTGGALGLDRTAKAAGSQSYFALRIVPGLAKDAPAPPFVRRDRIVVLDTSQSQSAETLAAAARLAVAAARSLDPDERFLFLACDAACSAHDKALVPATEAALSAAETWAKALVPGGSSDVAGALIDAASRLDDTGAGQIVYVGDGAATSGELVSEHVAARAKPWLAKKKVDVRLVGAGVTVDLAALSALGRELGATVQPLATGEALPRRLEQLAASLRMPVVRSPSLELPSSMTYVFPRKLPNLVVGEEVRVYGQLAAPEDGKPTRVRLSGELAAAPWELVSEVAWGAGAERQAAIVPRLWAAARIDDLVASGGPSAKKEIIELSKRFHVLSRYTSMLVLENDAMFAEMGITRTVPGTPGVPAGSGQAGSIAGVLSPAQAAALDAIPLGVLDGMSGSGAGVSSTGPGLRAATGGSAKPSGGLGDIGLGAVGTTVDGQQRVSMPRAEVTGSTPSSTSPIPNAPRVLAGARGRVRACYQRALANNPDEKGRAQYAIRVAPSGEVQNATVTGTGIGAQTVACIQGGLRALVFDPPEGGGATVTGAFQLTSREAPAPSPMPGGLISPWMPGPPPPTGPTASHRASDDGWRTEGEEALAKLRDAQAGAPKSRKQLEALVRGLLVRGRFDEALTRAKAFATDDPDAAAARELLSYAAVGGGETALALAAVDAGVETAPTAVRAHARAARAFEAAKDERRACAHWRSLVDLEPGQDEWQFESLRCRARVLADREGALADAKAIERPGKLVTKLVPLLEAGNPPAFDPEGGSVGQLEVSVTCAAGVSACPIPLVVAPNGTVFSPMTPEGARSSERAVAVGVVRDGTYRTMIAGGAPDARGEVTVRAAGVTQKFAFAQGGLRSIAATQVNVPSPWLSGIGIGRRMAW